MHGELVNKTPRFKTGVLAVWFKALKPGEIYCSTLCCFSMPCSNMPHFPTFNAYILQHWLILGRESVCRTFSLYRSCVCYCLCVVICLCNAHSMVLVTDILASRNVSYEWNASTCNVINTRLAAWRLNHPGWYSYCRRTEPSSAPSFCAVAYRGHCTHTHTHTDVWLQRFIPQKHVNTTVSNLCKCIGASPFSSWLSAIVRAAPDNLLWNERSTGRLASIYGRRSLRLLRHSHV